MLLPRQPESAFDKWLLSPVLQHNRMTPYDGVCIEQLPANIAGILIVIGRVAASLCFKAKLAGKQMT